MMKPRGRFLPVLLLMSLILAACGAPGSGDGGGNVARAMDRSVVNAYDRFAFKLLRELAADEAAENLFVSPTSIAVALSMVYNGADGETKEAMERTLEAQGITVETLNESNAAWLARLNSDDPQVELALANSIWVRQGVPVLEDFLDRNRTYYGAEVEEIDFDREDAADIINDWVSRQTRERIQEIVEAPIDSDTIMFLINALYFKGGWAVEFDEDQTRDRPFTLPDGSRGDVPMMHRTDAILYFEDDGLQAVSLPYGDGRFTMDVLLPSRDRSVRDLVERLDAETWAEWTQRYQEREVALALPRFTLEYEKSLNDALKALGMEVAFDEHRADFSRMMDLAAAGGNVYVKEVKHKTFLEVNEQGTEAAASTSVEMGITSAPEVTEFIVDRPFLLTIRDTETGTLLFIGVIVDPAA